MTIKLESYEAAQMANALVRVMWDFNDLEDNFDHRTQSDLFQLLYELTAAMAV